MPAPFKLFSSLKVYFLCVTGDMNRRGGGWAGAAQDFQIVSTQTLRVPKTGATAAAGSATPMALTPYVRFGVNPLTGAVIAQLLQ